MANKDLKNTPDKVSRPNDRSLIFVPDKISISHIPVGHTDPCFRQNRYFPYLTSRAAPSRPPSAAFVHPGTADGGYAIGLQGTIFAMRRKWSECKNPQSPCHGDKSLSHNPVI
jgi:hypothetical protein